MCALFFAGLNLASCQRQEEKLSEMGALNRFATTHQFFVSDSTISTKSIWHRNETYRRRGMLHIYEICETRHTQL
jgi:hypothetical protein